MLIIELENNFTDPVLEGYIMLLPTLLKSNSAADHHALALILLLDD